MKDQLRIKTDTSYSVNGIFAGKIYVGENVVGTYDTSHSRNVSLAWDDASGQYKMQALGVMEEIDPRELKSVIAGMIRNKKIRAK